MQASFESLRNTEQNTLFDAASAYMDVIRDRQIAVLTEQNLRIPRSSRCALRARGFEVGEGTRTDVAQADASRSSAVAQLERRARAGLIERGDLSPGRRRGAGQAEGGVRRWRSSCRRASMQRLPIADRPSILRSLRPASRRCGRLYRSSRSKARCCRRFPARRAVARTLRNRRHPISGPTRRHVDLRQHRRDADDPDLSGRPRFPRRSANPRNRLARRASKSTSAAIRFARPSVSAWTPVYRGAGKRGGQPRTRRGRAARAERRHRGAQCRPAHDARRARTRRPTSSPRRSISPARERDVVVASYAILSAIGALTAPAARSPGRRVQAAGALQRRQGQVVSACARRTAADGLQVVRHERNSPCWLARRCNLLKSQRVCQIGDSRLPASVRYAACHDSCERLIAIGRRQVWSQRRRM